MERKRKYDWEKIEGEFRAGQLSIREIARRNGCSESAIRKNAKNFGWTRDLAKRVTAAVRNKLVRDSVRTDPKKDSEIVEAAAERGAGLIRSHRSDINNLRTLEQNLLQLLSADPVKPYITHFQGEIVEATVTIPVTERCHALSNLANALHKRIQLERQAFNLNEGAETGGSLDRLAEILKKADAGGLPMPAMTAEDETSED